MPSLCWWCIWCSCLSFLINASCLCLLIGTLWDSAQISASHSFGSQRNACWVSLWSLVFSLTTYLASGVGCKVASPSWTGVPWGREQYLESLFCAHCFHILLMKPTSGQTLLLLVEVKCLYLRSVGVFTARVVVGAVIVPCQHEAAVQEFSTTEIFLPPTPGGNRHLWKVCWKVRSLLLHEENKCPLPRLGLFMAHTCKKYPGVGVRSSQEFFPGGWVLIQVFVCVLVLFLLFLVILLLCCHKKDNTEERTQA